MNRQTLSILAPLIQKEFRLDNAQLGALFSAFFVSYGVAVALVGELIDRLSIRIAFAAAVAWWSLTTSLAGLARSFGQLLGFRLSLGLGEVANWPVTARLVSMYLPPRERTLTNSIYMGGGSLGLDVGYLASGFVVLALGRRGWTVLKARRPQQRVIYSSCCFIQPDVLWKFATALPGGTRLSQASRNDRSRVISMTGIRPSRCATFRVPIRTVVTPG